MMGKICVHDDDEVPSSMLHAMDVGSAFDRKQELISSWQRLLEQIHQLFPLF